VSVGVCRNPNTTCIAIKPSGMAHKALGLVSGMLPDFAPLINKSLSYMPDRALRHAIRWQLWDRLREYSALGIQEQQEYKQAFVDQLKRSPVALLPEKANEQHYEVPPPFYQLCLGKRLKYSCAYYPTKDTTLDEAEEHMLALYCQRAEIKDGMSILDLGCGWGSFSLYACERFPSSPITAVSNSNNQREFIQGEAKRKGFKNLTVITCDANELTAEKLNLTAKSETKASVQGSGKKGKKEQGEGKSESPSAGRDGFDRIISIEMFEHMKNYEKLIQNLSAFLKQSGKMFVHIFTCRDYPYHFVDQEGNWMTRYFFAGGTMPSDDLLLYFQKHLQIVKHWRVSGMHYSYTSRDWLALMDKNATQIKKLFNDAYGKTEGHKWWVMWRVFYLAVEETFGYNNGRDWLVSHYLFQHPTNNNTSNSASTEAGTTAPAADAE